MTARAPRQPSRSVVIAGVSGGLGVALARAYAAPGVTLGLTGGNAWTVARAADDCRQRGAAVDTASRPGDLSAFDAPVDALLVLGQGLSVGGDLGPLEPAAAILASMRRRGRGEIVLVSTLAGRVLSDAPGEARRSARALLDCAAALRRQLRADGISVAVIVPGSLAIRAAALLCAPPITAIEADRLAARIGRTRRWRRRVIAVPGPAGVALRVLRLLPSRLCEAARNALAPRVAAIGEPADETPLPGESGLGD